ncbi:MAG: beta strand repeat-containing protein [Pelagibaca sp.]
MARVILSAGETYNTANDDTQILGSGGTEQVVILNGVTGATVDGNVERVDFSGAIADYTFSSTGGQLNVFDTDGNLVAQISDSGGKQVVFSDGALDVAVDGTGLTVGGEDIPGVDLADPTAPVVPAAITPAPGEVDGTTTSDAPTFGDGDTGGGDTGGGGTDDTFTLTTGVDSGSAFTGTAADDTFNAALGTFNPFDAIDGGDGTDRLNAQVNTTDYGSDVDLDSDTANIEQFYLLTTVAANDYDFANVTSATQIWTDRSTVTGSDYINIEQAVTAGVNETATAADTSTWTYSNDALGDDDATQAMVVNAASQTVAVEVGGADVITGLAITATGENTIILGGTDLIAATMTDLTVSGAGSIDLDMTANAAADHTVTLGGGDDTLRFDAANLDASDTLDLGAGTGDVLALIEGGDNSFDDTELGFDLSGVSNAEGLALIDDVTLGGDATLDLADFDNVTFEDELDAGTAGDALTLATSSASLTVLFEGDAGQTTAAPDLIVDENVTSLTIEQSNDGGLVELNGLTNESTTDDDTLATLTLSDTSDAGDGTFTVALGDGTDPTAGLTSIVLSGGAESNFIIDATNADYDAPVTIQIDDSGIDDVAAADALDYTNDDATVREIFQFTGDNIGDVTISDFTVGASGGADRIDFSMFAAVTGIGDLAISVSGGNIEITAQSDEFDGTIELTGLTDINAVETDGFIF